MGMFSLFGSWSGRHDFDSEEERDAFLDSPLSAVDDFSTSEDDDGDDD